jgi:hypothetical protein
MEKNCKIAIIVILFACFFLVDKESMQKATLLHFQHANIFHLLANAWSIHLIKRAKWIPAYIIAVLCALPFTDNTLGFSGVIFAALGIIYGRYPSKLFVWAVAIVLVTGLLPSIHVLFHLICLFAGFFVGYIYQLTKLYVEYRNR